MLHLFGTKFDSRLPIALSKCDSLTDVTFSGDWSETPWKALSTMKGLKAISFLNCNLKGDELIHLTHLPELDELSIFSDHFELSHLAQLETCPKLRDLTVFCVDEAVGPIYPNLLKIETLRKASILFTNSTPEATAVFEKELEKRLNEDREKGILPPEDE